MLVACVSSVILLGRKEKVKIRPNKGNISKKPFDTRKVFRERVSIDFPLLSVRDRRRQIALRSLSPTSVVTMFLTRVLGRRLFVAASTRSESTTSAAAAAASAIRTPKNPLEEFFEFDRSQDEDKPVVYGRGWKASELRLKSWDDLSKLWYVLLKEKNMLMTQRQMLQAQNMNFPNPERIPKVRRSMCRIKHVLTERAIEEPDPRRSAEMKRMVNAM